MVLLCHPAHQSPVHSSVDQASCASGQFRGWRSTYFPNPAPYAPRQGDQPISPYAGSSSRRDENVHNPHPDCRCVPSLFSFSSLNSCHFRHVLGLCVCIYSTPHFGHIFSFCFRSLVIKRFFFLSSSISMFLFLIPLIYAVVFAPRLREIRSFWPRTYLRPYVTAALSPLKSLSILLHSSLLFFVSFKVG